MVQQGTSRYEGKLQNSVNQADSPCQITLEHEYQIGKEFQRWVES